MARGKVENYCCVLCKKEISLIAKTRHERSCDGIAKVYKKTHVNYNCCQYCNTGFPSSNGTSNHEIQCSKNPNRIFRKTNYSWNRGQRSKPDTRNPDYIGKNGGYRSNAGRSKKFKVYDSYGKLTTIQSTYELATFEILCELGIRWNRPKSLKYDGRNYFADFYLPDYEIWLDPKNDYKAKCDEEKIRSVIEQNGVKLFVLLKEQITKEYIGRLAEMD